MAAARDPVVHALEQIADELWYLEQIADALHRIAHTLGTIEQKLGTIEHTLGAARPAPLTR
jgi:hypothetical protein